MRLHTLLAVAGMVCALPAIAAELPTAPAPRETGWSAVVRLRNVAAADAADALTKHFKGKANEPRVTFDVVTNTVSLSAGPAALQAAVNVLVALDAEPKQIVVTAVVMQVSDEFVKSLGQTVGAKPGASVWTLSARDVQALNGLLRAAKAKGECDILSCPRVQVVDNQTGHVQIGQDGGAGITLRVTPRVKPDGNVLLRAEAQVAEGGPTATTHTVQTTAELKAGETLVARVGGALVIVTPHVVK